MERRSEPPSIFCILRAQHLLARGIPGIRTFRGGLTPLPTLTPYLRAAVERGAIVARDYLFKGGDSL